MTTTTTTTTKLLHSGRRRCRTRKIKRKTQICYFQLHPIRWRKWWWSPTRRENRFGQTSRHYRIWPLAWNESREENEKQRQHELKLAEKYANANARQGQSGSSVFPLCFRFGFVSKITAADIRLKYPVRSISSSFLLFLNSSSNSSSLVCHFLLALRRNPFQSMVFLYL